MGLIDLFQKTRETSMEMKPQEDEAAKVVTCKGCGAELKAYAYGKNLYVCPHCGRYGRLLARTRIRQIADKDSFEELYANLAPADPIHFPGYAEKTAELAEKVGMPDAVKTGVCKIGGVETAIGVMDSHFMMASMGSVVGEKLTRLFEYATEKGLPVVLFTCSGGARMQEGMFSLLQMAKVSAAARRHSDAGLLYITVLTDPTTGGDFQTIRRRLARADDGYGGNTVEIRPASAHRQHGRRIRDRPQAVRISAVTDPDHIRVQDPGKLEGNTVFTYLDAFCQPEHFAEFLPDYQDLDELKAHCRRGGLGDVKVKKFLNNVMQSLLSPMRERRAQWEGRLPEVYEILKKGSEIAAETAQGTLDRVRHAMKIDYFTDNGLLK